MVSVPSARAAASSHDDDEEEVVEETVEVVDDHSAWSSWMGMRVGSVLTPFRVIGRTPQQNRVIANQARACLDPLDVKYCGTMRGFDLRFEMFHAGSKWSYPRWTGYFRTGYTAGRFDFEPRDDEAGFGPGEPQSLSYHTVPLFFGGNVYLFREFPVRPYAGMGFGFDVLRVQYDRGQRPDTVDASARIGFELHAGLEARLTNYVSVSAEIMQLWSARRKIDGVPDYSNEGLTVMAGIGFAIPTRKHGHHHHVRTVKKVKKVKKVEKVETVEREMPPPTKRVVTEHVVTEAPGVRVEVTQSVTEPPLAPPPTAAPPVAEPSAPVAAEPAPESAPPPAEIPSEPAPMESAGTGTGDNLYTPLR
jgi:hypothetical protein